MGPKAIFDKSSEHVAVLMACATPEHFTEPTPCSEWNVKALINHMINEVSWLPDLLAGKTIEEVGDKYDGDLAGDQPLVAWKRALKAAEEAVKAADVEKIVHLSYADVPAG